MKKVLAIALALLMAFSMSAIAFAEDAPAEDAAIVVAAADDSTAAAGFDFAAILDGIKDIGAKILALVNGEITIQDAFNDLVAKVTSFVEGLTASANVAGALDNLESKLGFLKLDGSISEKIAELVNNLKQKIKNLYAGEVATTVEEVVEETTAEEPAETGSTSAGIVAFAAVSVACAAAYVCSKKD